MIFEQSILFFFSAIGAFNGFFLSIYFAFFIKQKSRATYFLTALILVISVRMLNTTFFFFSNEIPDIFRITVHSAYALTGPLLYLYVRASTYKEDPHASKWWFYIVPVIIFMVGMQMVFPFHSHLSKWYILSNVLFALWFGFMALSARMIKSSFLKIYKKEKLSDEEFWLVNITVITAFIWLAFFAGSYVHHIVGTFSFSFIFYIMLLLWLHKRRKSHPFFHETPKYANKTIALTEADHFGAKLDRVLREEELYKNIALKLADVAGRIGVSSHYLSQYLNDNLGHRFTSYINTYRIEAAEQMLKEKNHLTLEAIGTECGFKSNSSFYAAFKKCKGITPAQYKKTLN